MKFIYGFGQVSLAHNFWDIHRRHLLQSVYLLAECEDLFINIKSSDITAYMSASFSWQNQTCKVWPRVCV